MHAPAARERLHAAPRSRSAAEPAARGTARSRVASHPGGRPVAQLAALANAGSGVVQRWGALAVPAGGGAAAVPPTSDFTPLPPTASKTFRGVGSTTAPADPGDMPRWKRHGVLRDPSKGGRQALTRMHAIRGKFGGPSRDTNMFLGTALSNNFSSESHYNLVEEPLEKYLKGKRRGETRAVEYSVTPHTNNIPAYIHDRIHDLPTAQDRDDFTAYANDHIPNGITCNATLYNQDAAGIVSSAALRPQPVSTTVGAPLGPAPVVAAPVAPALLGPAHAQAVGNAIATVRTGTAMAHATASESGALGTLGYGALGTAVGGGIGGVYAAGGLAAAANAVAAGYAAGGVSALLTAGAAALSGPIGWTALGLGALGAIYGYATAEND